MSTLTREAIVYYAVVGGALAACLLVLAGMGLKKLKEVIQWNCDARRAGRSCSRTTSAR